MNAPRVPRVELRKENYGLHVAWCHGQHCDFVATSPEKTDVQRRARAHRKDHANEPARG